MKEKEKVSSHVPSPSLGLFCQQTKGGLLLVSLLLHNSLPLRGSVFTQYSTDSFKTNVLIHWLPRELRCLCRWCLPEQAPARPHTGSSSCDKGKLYCLDSDRGGRWGSSFLAGVSQAFPCSFFLCHHTQDINLLIFPERLVAHISVRWCGIVPLVLPGEECATHDVLERPFDVGRGKSSSPFNAFPFIPLGVTLPCVIC